MHQSYSVHVIALPDSERDMGDGYGDESIHLMWLLLSAPFPLCMVSLHVDPFALGELYLDFMTSTSIYLGALQASR